MFVSVINLNDNLPKLDKRQYHARIFENATVGKDVMTIKASDPDQLGPLTYFINSSIFDVDQDIDNNGNIG